MQETLDAKHAFEHIAEQHGIHICHYHCDNGRFADQAFMDNVYQTRQTITLCGVGNRILSKVQKSFWS